MATRLPGDWLSELAWTAPPRSRSRLKQRWRQVSTDPALRSRTYRRRSDSERAIRSLIAAHGAVLRPAGNRADCRGFGTAINHHLKPHLVCSTFDGCRADAIEGHGG